MARHKQTREEKDRFDFRKVFGTPEGKRVMLYLYERLNAKTTTMPQDGNPTLLAWNEGKRFAWLLIQEMMREDDPELRRMWGQYHRDRTQENMSSGGSGSSSSSTSIG